MSLSNDQQSLTIASAADAWVAVQRARRKPLADPTIASYCDAWRSFAAWAARQDKRAVAEIGVHDLARWIDSLSRKADGTALTYSHGALAICKFLADRGELTCDLALLRMHLRDALPRAPDGLALDVADLRDDNGAIAPRTHVVGKGNRRRAVFIRAHAQRAVERYLLARRVSFPKADALLISHGPRGAGGRLNRVAAWAVV